MGVRLHRRRLVFLAVLALGGFVQSRSGRQNTVWGATIDGQIVVHKAGATILWHLQKTQYLRYWKTRRGAGAWAENAYIEGHAAACRWARKGNPRGLSCAHYKEMNSRHPTLDIQHLRNSKYEPPTPEAATC